MRQRNLKTQRPPVSLEIRSGKQRDNGDVIVFRKLYFQRDFCPPQNAKPLFSNSSGWNSVFQRLRFRDGIVWTVRLTVEIKLCLQIPPVRCGKDFADVFSACDFFFLDDQQEFISKAKDTIAAATEKCKDIENKMKVCCTFI